MASAINEDKKYDETVYRYKKPVISSDIIITIGSKLFIGETYYGTIVKESESFYYIQTHYSEELVEFMKESVQDKLSNKVLRLVD